MANAYWIKALDIDGLPLKTFMAGRSIADAELGLAKLTTDEGRDVLPEGTNLVTLWRNHEMIEMRRRDGSRVEPKTNE